MSEEQSNKEIPASFFKSLEGIMSRMTLAEESTTISENKLTEETLKRLQDFVNASCVVVIPGITDVGGGINGVIRDWMYDNNADDAYDNGVETGEYFERYQAARIIASEFGIIPSFSWKSAWDMSLLSSVEELLESGEDYQFEYAGIPEGTVLGFDDRTPPDDWPTRDPEEVVEVPEKYRF